MGGWRVDERQCVVLGAGPHGLAAAAHLRRAQVETHVIGDPMSFWRTMPTGMLLRSNWTATSIAEYDGALSLDSYRDDTGAQLSLPVPLDSFLDYGLWVQRRAVPDVDRRGVRQVRRNGRGLVLTMGDGEQIATRSLVVAAGISDFVHRPLFTLGLPSELVSHTSEHTDLGVFHDRSVLVVGGGQSALESAALLHERDAEVEVIARADHLNWLHGGKYHRMLGRWAKLVYAPTDVGPMGISRIVAVPGLFRQFPRKTQDAMARRAIRPAGAAWLRPRLEGVPVHTGVQVRSTEPVGDRLRVALSDGSARMVDHLLLGTGYRVDIARYPFLDPDLVSSVRTERGYPVLGPGMESSVPGLHFLGAPAAWSFGPIMRFVAGGWFGAESLTSCLSGGRRRSARPAPEPMADTA